MCKIISKMCFEECFPMIGQSRRTHKRSGFVSRFGSPAAPPGFIGSHRSPQREEVQNGVWGAL